MGHDGKGIRIHTSQAESPTSPPCGLHIRSTTSRMCRHMARSRASCSTCVSDLTRPWPAGTTSGGNSLTDHVSSQGLLHGPETSSSDAVSGRLVEFRSELQHLVPSTHLLAGCSADLKPLGCLALSSWSTKQTRMVDAHAIKSRTVSFAI